MIGQRVADLYDSKGGGEIERCPGESACEFYEAAAGETREDKLRNSCNDCHLLSSKPHDNQRILSDNESDSILDFVEQLRRERDSSKSNIDLSDISFLIWRLLQIYDSQIEGYERNLRIETKDWLKILANKGL